MARGEKQLNSLSIKVENKNVQKSGCMKKRECLKVKLLISPSDFNASIYTHNMEAGLFDYRKYSLGY